MTYDNNGSIVDYISSEPNNKYNINNIKGKGDKSLNGNLTQEKSIYIQISEMIENDILRDIILEEERVPSTNELAKLYAINPATAAKGINILVDNGVLYKKRGIGMFVETGAKEKIQERRKKEFSTEYVQKFAQEAKSLCITKQEIMELINKAYEE